MKPSPEMKSSKKQMNPPLYGVEERPRLLCGVEEDVAALGNQLYGYCRDGVGNGVQATCGHEDGRRPLLSQMGPQNRGLK
jgi:hypothetical protein